MAEETEKSAPKKGERRIPKFRRRAAARPDEVLDAALDLFIEKGYSATRVEDIAKRAGISKGSVYLYFPSKEALLEGLVKRAILPVARGVISVAESFEGDPREAISMFMHRLARQSDNPKLFAIPKIILREAVIMPEIAEMYRTAVLNQAIPVLEALIRKGIAGGYFRNVDPEMTVRSIIGPLMAHLVLSEIFGVTPEGGLDLERLVENHLTILFDGLSAPQKELS